MKMDYKTKRFRFQISMFQKGADEIQKHISRIDEILFKIKASCVTVWVAILGWSFSTHNTLMVPLGGVIIIGFWFLEGYFRGIQSRFLISSQAITEFLNNQKKLDDCFNKQRFETNLVYPMTHKESEFVKLKMYAKGLIAPSVGILYIFLSFINYLIWLAL